MNTTELLDRIFKSVNDDDTDYVFVELMGFCECNPVRAYKFLNAAIQRSGIHQGRLRVIYDAHLADLLGMCIHLQNF